MQTMNSDNLKKDPLDELFFNKPVRVHVREFGAIFALLCLIIAGGKAWVHGRESLTGITVCFALAAAFAGLGYGAPRVLLPVWRLWMKLAHVLSIVMTSLILLLAWVLAFIPMGILLKILRIKVLDSSYGAKVDSYWESRDAKYDDFKRLELQY